MGLVSSKGRLIPAKDFKLYSDLGELKVPEEKKAKILHRANQYMKEEIPFLPASLYREFFINGNRANFEAKCFLRRQMALYLAMAEYVTGEGRYLEKLIDAVWAIMEESTWTIPAHLYNSPTHQDATLGPAFGENNLHGLALFSASTAATLSAVYYLCKDKLDAVEPLICEKIAYTVRQRSIINFLQTEFWWGGRLGCRVDNWNPWIVSNVLFSTAVIEKDDYIRSSVVDKCISYLDNFIDGYFPDGGCEEGPHYWCAAGGCLMNCLELIEELSGGQITVWNSELIRNIGEYIYKVNINGNRFVNFADGHSRTTVLSSMLVRFGEKLNSPFLTAFGKKQADICNFQAEQSYPYRALRCIFTEESRSEKCDMPLDTWLPDIQVMTARECRDSERGMFLGAKFGHNDEFHNHNDVGNFTVYYDGKPVIIDPGVGVYTRQTFSSRRYELWFMQSGFHNLPSFGGVDQKEGLQYKATDVSYDESSRRMSAELKDAYPSESGIVSYVRDISFDGKAVHINENVTLSEKKDIVFHIMTLEEPKLVRAGEISLSEGRTLVYDKALTAEISEISTEGMDMNYSWSYDKMHRTTFTINTDKCNVKFTIK